jgi:hypothetical protein
MIRMQGGSVVATYLKRPEWKIRDITLYPSKPAAKKLGEQGVEIVLADFNDDESLYAAFKVNRPNCPDIDVDGIVIGGNTIFAYASLSLSCIKAHFR